jgi:hypothetical protein
MASPSDAVVEALSLPFAGSSGRGVRVAVIDSGVNQRHPHIASLEGGICIGENAAVEEGDYSDYLGHGTAVTAAIQEKAPDAKYFAARLFQNSLRTSTEGLFNALDWAIAQRMDVINLSLGTRNAVHAPRFTAVIERALERGVLIVAARDADGDRCYPGSLPGTISVGLDWDCPRQRYRYEQTADGPVFYASGYPRSLPGMSRERNLNGISFAVANMCGFVIRAAEAVAKSSSNAKRSPEAMRSALIAEALTLPAR